MTLGVLAAIGTLFCWSFGTLAFLKASRIIYPALLNRARLMLAAIGTALLTCISMQIFPWELFTHASAMQWVWMGLSGIVGLTLGDLFGFSALRILGARRQSVFGTIAPVASGISAFFLLSESLSIPTMLGMAICITGVMYAMNNAEEKAEVHREGFGAFGLGILLAIGGAIGQGLGLVLAKIGMQAGGLGGSALTPLYATFMRMLVGFASTYVVDVLRRDHIRPLRLAFADSAGVKAMMQGTVLGPILGVSLSLFAAREINVAIASTIFSLVPFVVMGIAAVVHKERLRARTFVGAAIAVAGIQLLVWN
ncbi:MAG: DMT family transporter [Ignavibacteria bacterium]|nr:DMT family transporter [Ignavibacteria bacterium]